MRIVLLNLLVSRLFKRHMALEFVTYGEGGSLSAISNVQLA